VACRPGQETRAERCTGRFALLGRPPPNCGDGNRLEGLDAFSAYNNGRLWARWQRFGPLRPCLPAPRKGSPRDFPVLCRIHHCQEERAMLPTFRRERRLRQNPPGTVRQRRRPAGKKRDGSPPRLEQLEDRLAPTVSSPVSGSALSPPTDPGSLVSFA